MSGDDKIISQRIPPIKAAPIPRETPLPRQIADAGISSDSANLIRAGVHAHMAGDDNAAMKAMAIGSLSIMGNLLSHKISGMVSGGETTQAHGGMQFTPVADRDTHEAVANIGKKVASRT